MGDGGLRVRMVRGNWNGVVGQLLPSNPNEDSDQEGRKNISDAHARTHTFTHCNYPDVSS